jgi:hypothetical protein
MPDNNIYNLELLWIFSFSYDLLTDQDGFIFFTKEERQSIYELVCN